MSLKKVKAAVAGALLCAMGHGHEVHGAELSHRNVNFNIEPKALDAALQDFAAQANLTYLFAPDPTAHAETFQAPAIHGLYSVDVALRKLLAGSGLIYEFVNETSVTISRPTATSPTPDETKAAARPQTAPDVIVQAKRGINADIQRTRHEPQPYVVIDRAGIERSGATSPEELLRHHIPVTGTGEGTSQAGTVGAGRSQINLRGLGTSDTLVLVDGRRVAQLFIGGSGNQLDLSALPLAAVDRVEVLSSTASGIYGGGATGGVVNFVLRHDCKDTRLMAEYGNSFSADARNSRVFFSHCLSTDRQRTQLQLSGSVSNESGLRTGDRRFVQRGREKIAENNPLYYPNSPVPPVGAQTNLRTADGSGFDGPGSPSIATVAAGSQGPAGLLVGHYNLDLAHTAQPEGGDAFTLRNALQTRYLDALLTQQFSEGLKAYADIAAARSDVHSGTNVGVYAGLNGMFVPASAPGNPTRKDIILTAPAIGGDGQMRNLLDSYRITAGVDWALPRSWDAGLELTAARWDFRWKQLVAGPADDAVATGTLNVFQDLSHTLLDFTSLESDLYTSRLTSESDTASLRVARSPFTLRAGDVTLVALAEYRRERFGGGLEYMAPKIRSDGTEPTPVTVLTKQSRQIRSGYVEVHVPIGAVTIEEPAVDRVVPMLEVQLAGRIDHYDIDAAQPRAAPGSLQSRVPSTFTTANPTIGVQFRPHAGITLRGSYAKGFLPPSGDQLAPPAPRQLFPGDLRDPRRGGEPIGFVDFTAGGNPMIEPEHSHTWSAGLLLEPGSLPGLQVSLDRVQISKTNDIVSPADEAITDFAQFEIEHPDRVTRGPVSAGDPSGVGPIIAIDASDLNIAESQLVAWDAFLRYDARNVPLGKLSFTALATWHPSYRTRATPMSPGRNDVAVTADSPLGFGAVAGLTFARGDWEFGWSTRYFGAYRVGWSDILIQSQGSRDVPHQTYHDASVRYRVPTHGSNAASSMDIQLNVQNVFNRDPPFDAGAQSYYSHYGDPRRGTYSVSFTVHF